MQLKSIHSSKVWRGAVIAIKEKGRDGFPPVFYHVDWIDKKRIHLTAIHKNETYNVKYEDRYFYIRDFRK